MPPAEPPPVFVLAAGLGTRLGFTSAKTLFPVGGRPLLEWILRECERQGARRVIVTILRRHERALDDFLAHGVPPGIRLSVSVDERPQGTLGTLRNAWSTYPCEEFHVWLGDIVGRPPLSRLAPAARGAPAALLAHRRRDYENSGVLTVDGAQVLSGFREKPGRLGTSTARVWAGVATFGARILDGRAGDDLGRDLWPALAAEGGCRVLDCGPDDTLVAVDRREDADGLPARLRSAGVR